MVQASGIQVHTLGYKPLQAQHDQRGTHYFDAQFKQMLCLALTLKE